MINSNIYIENMEDMQMINNKLKTDKGITLIILIISIIIMIIISSMLIYNAQTGSKMKALNDMYKDIEVLKDRIDIYYSKYGTLPILNTKYTNVNGIKGININDNDNYFVIDLESIENLTLTYGKDYIKYKDTRKPRIKRYLCG